MNQINEQKNVVTHNSEKNLFHKAYEFQKAKKLNDAKAIYETILAVNPSHVSSYYNLGLIYQEQKDFLKAERMYQKVIHLYPNANVYYNLGILYTDQSSLDKAILMYQEALKLNSSYLIVYNNLGNLYREQNCLDKAIQMYQEALKLNPQYWNASVNLSLIYLLRGDYLSGFELYENRWNIIARHSSKPVWNSVNISLSNKTLLIYSEQGLGDTIQFCRYLDMLMELGCYVIFEVDSALAPFLKQLERKNLIILTRGNELPPFDYHCSLLSLPFIFKTSLENIPFSKHYLMADSYKIAYWKKRLQSQKIKIGLVWNGSSTHKGDSNRSLTLAGILEYLPKNQCEYICLQKEVRAFDQDLLERSGVLFFGQELNDFNDTAALCSLMDLVVSVDTSVAHLAASLGKKTWVLLPYTPDWRWMLDREDSPWYSSIKLIRQDALYDWNSALTKLKKQLIDFLAQ